MWSRCSRFTYNKNSWTKTHDINLPRWTNSGLLQYLAIYRCFGFSYNFLSISWQPTYWATSFYHNSHVEVWGKLMCPMLCTHGWNNQTHEESKRQHSHICKITYMQCTYMAKELLLESRLPDRNNLLQYPPWQMCQELKNKENQKRHNYQLIKKTPWMFLVLSMTKLVSSSFLDIPHSLDHLHQKVQPSNSCLMLSGSWTKNTITTKVKDTNPNAKIAILGADGVRKKDTITNTGMLYTSSTIF